MARMKAKHWTDALVQAHACQQAIDFGRQYRSFAAAWRACDQPQWLLWWAARQIGEQGSPSHRQLVRVTYACAATALRYVPKGEDRPRQAIAAARRWAAGKAELAEVRAAASAVASTAYAAADAAYAAAAADRASANRRLCAIIRRTYPRPHRARKPAR